MMRLKNILVPAMAGVFALTTQLTQAQDLPKPSPMSKVEQRVGLTDMSIAYSRPSVKGRKVWGELVPYGKLWRTGANAPTIFTTSDPITIGGQSLPAGSYSLFTIPGKESWEVMLNSNTEGWGTGNYKEENNVVRFKVKPVMIDPIVETMEMGFSDFKKNTATMYLRWDKMHIGIPIKVDVEAKAMANIKTALAEKPEDAGVLRSAANYTAETGKQLEDGLKWINQSIEIEEYWYSYWVKADVLAAMKDYKKAIEAAQKSIELGEKAMKEQGKEFKYKAELEAEIAKWKAVK